MVGLSYASVPLYRLFCQVTGFGGTTQRAEAAPERATDKPGLGALRCQHLRQPRLVLPCRPDRDDGEGRRAEHGLLQGHQHFGQAASPARAVFNVTPVQAGAYFNKIQCFCFTEQTLKPGEAIEMPVSFFVDPDMLDDPDAAGIKEITLSYTFYPVDKPKAVSEAPAAASGSVAN